MKFVQKMIDDSDCEPVSGDDKAGEMWYIPHHGVIHPQKQKLRVVFDCSAKFAGTSLNDHLLQGPDLMNDMFGILSRFRKNHLAVACDIEKMCHRFHVAPQDRNYLRFLWWEGGDTSINPSEYGMNVHVSGASSSHIMQMYALKKIRLHKFISNDRNVIQSIPNSERAAVIQNMDLTNKDLPTERTLGIHWNTQDDCFSFQFKLKETPNTRRGVLSTIASIYDPMGFISPFVLLGKSMLQEICKWGVSWDDAIPENLCPKWEAWKANLIELQNITIPRCLLPKDITKQVQWNFIIAVMSAILDMGAVLISVLLTKIKHTALL